MSSARGHANNRIEWYDLRTGFGLESQQHGNPLICGVQSAAAHSCLESTAEDAERGNLSLNICS